MNLVVHQRCFILDPWSSTMTARVRDDHLQALAACVDEGTFDGAAAVLRVTPSAISQRIKALEQAIGQVVLVRSTPVRVTAVGEVLLRAARQRALVDGELARALARQGRRGAVIDLPVAVNADSLATWFVEVLETVGGWGDARLRVFVEDQDHSARLLREGAVLGAVTASSAAVQGCSVRDLGVMRYVPLVRRDLWERFGGVLGRTPTVRFNGRDDLQRRVLRGAGVGMPPVEHVVPSAEGFAAAVRAGLGWGMVPEGMVPAGMPEGAVIGGAALDGVAAGGGEAVGGAEEGGEGVGVGVGGAGAVDLSAVGGSDLMRVPGLDVLDVPLYWQCWRLETAALARLTDEVASAAHRLR